MPFDMYKCEMQDHQS